MSQNDNRLLMRSCVEGLSCYAVERQIGFEQHQANGDNQAPERRNQRIRNLIAGICERYGLSDHITGEIMQPFERRLEEARRCAASEAAPLAVQRDVVAGLWQYAQDLCGPYGDPRVVQLQIRDQLDEIAAYPPWGSQQIGLSHARDWVSMTLTRLTALQPIRFTRLLLGPEVGPADSVFLSGAVKDANAVRETKLYREFCGRYPARREWPAICVVYQGGRNCLQLHDATELDLGIMRETGDRFLNQKGISWIGGPYEMKIMVGPEASEHPTQGMEMSL